MDVFYVLYSNLETYLKSPQWELKDAAILALGAIADQDGSLPSIIPHLELLVPFLIEELKNDNEQVRATTCWTLSKFSAFIANQSNQND